MIELNDLQFAYAEGEFALQVKNLTVTQGQRCCWVGPSGSGKTTLLHLIAGIFPPDAGHVKTCGVELTGLSDATRRAFRIAKIGLVFQDFALLDYLSVVDNILLPYRINPALQLDASVGQRAEQLASTVGLRKLLSRRPAQLSQGERQRVAVCRSLIARPELLLGADSGLDTDRLNRLLEDRDDTPITLAE